MPSRMGAFLAPVAGEFKITMKKARKRAGLCVHAVITVVQAATALEKPAKDLVMVSCTGFMDSLASVTESSLSSAAWR